MHARIYSEFRKIVSELRPSGRVLEIGAVADASSLLAMPELSQATALVGINLAPASSYKNFAIVSGNANHMPMFADASSTAFSATRRWSTILIFGSPAERSAE